jgi:hypothetical protein
MRPIDVETEGEAVKRQMGRDKERDLRGQTGGKTQTGRDIGEGEEQRYRGRDRK